MQYPRNIPEIAISRRLHLLRERDELIGENLTERLATDGNAAVHALNFWVVLRDKPYLARVRGNPRDLYLDLLRRQVRSLGCGIYHHLPALHGTAAFELLDLLRILHSDVNAELPLKAIADNIPESFKVRRVQVFPRIEVQVLAVARRAVAEPEASASLKVQTRKPFRFSKRLKNLIVNELFLNNGQQSLDAISLRYTQRECLKLTHRLQPPPNQSAQSIVPREEGLRRPSSL